MMTAVAQNLRSMEVAKSKFLFNSDYNPVYLFPITASSLLLTSYHLFFAYLFILCLSYCHFQKGEKFACLVYCSSSNSWHTVDDQQTFVEWVSENSSTCWLCVYVCTGTDECSCMCKNVGVCECVCVCVFCMEQVPVFSPSHVYYQVSANTACLAGCLIGLLESSTRAFLEKNSPCRASRQAQDTIRRLRGWKVEAALCVWCFISLGGVLVLPFVNLSLDTCETNTSV